MLSSVLGSETAVDMNIRIMRAFTASQQIMESHAILYKRVFNLEQHQQVCAITKMEASPEAVLQLL